MSLLTKEDRCDRCPAEAVNIIVLRSGGELLLCVHHTNKHLAALESAGAVILDALSPEDTQEVPRAEIDRLNQQPAAAVRTVFISRTGDPWFEVSPGRYTIGRNRADAEDRYRRTGTSTTPEALRMTFPIGHFTEEPT